VIGIFRAATKASACPNRSPSGNNCDRSGLIALDLCEVEHGEGPGEHAAGVGFAVVMIIIGARCGLLPEHDGGSALTLADLSAKSCPLAIGPPKTTGIAAGFGGNPERQHIDTAIATAGGDVLRPRRGSAIMVPGHAPIAGTGFDGRDNLGGDARIDVGSRRRRVGSGHGGSPRRAEGNSLPLLQPVTRKPASSPSPATPVRGVAAPGAICSRTRSILATSA
jgi:hypothetical protein